MNARRLVIYLLVLLALALAGYGVTLWGLFACAPAPLPGDELWTWRQNAGLALDLVTRLGSTACFTADAAGATALWLGARTGAVLLVALALIVLWETLGRELRLRWFGWRGGHVVLAGSNDDLAEIARRHGRFAGTFFLAPDRGARDEIGRHRPFAEIVALDGRRIARQLSRLRVHKANLLAATTRNDLTNVATAEAGLAAPGRGEIVVRLEQPAVRALSSHRLRLAAARQGRPLTVVSLTQVQTRRGLAAAMPGRYRLDGAPRVHIALCGSGPGLQAAAFEVARQGYGLETEPPLLSILRTGASDFSAAALQRLQTSGIAEVEISDVMTAADGLDRAIGALMQNAPPLLAVHCVGETGAEAEAIALRWEETLLGLHQPVPPLVAYTTDDRPLGRTGMIRVAVAQNLAEAREAVRLMDQRARAVHQAFLDAQRAARGPAFGDQPAEVDWQQLPESFQDDNRNVADQMDYKLAVAQLLAVPGTTSVALSHDEVEVLAGIAHARWMASKGVAGWRYGPQRDNAALLHPDMVPYADLTEPEKQKDRDEVATLPQLAALAGESLRRERRIGVPRPLHEQSHWDAPDNLHGDPKVGVPVAVLPLDDPEMVRFARALAARGARIEAILDNWSDALLQDEQVAADLAALLRGAWRIYRVRSADARSVLADDVNEMMDENGLIDALD